VGGNGESTEFFGYLLAENSQAHNLVKQGAGTFTLWAENHLRGPTRVEGGTLEVNGFVTGLFEVNYAAGASGNDIVLTAVTRPAATIIIIR
jgi:autotransporter-associated beta strand protein